MRHKQYNTGQRPYTFIIYLITAFHSWITVLSRNAFVIRLIEQHQFVLGFFLFCFLPKQHYEVAINANVSECLEWYAK